MSRTVVAEKHVVIDYPQQHEIITSPQYTIRLAVSDETQTVAVSIDGGPWQDCRKAAGYFWFDWANYLTGRHELIARATLFNGQTEETGREFVRVELKRAER